MVKETCNTLLQVAPDPVFLVDPDTRGIVETNESAATLLGYERTGLESLRMTTLYPDARTDDYRAVLTRTIENDTVRTAELPDGSQLYLETASGDRVPVELHARHVEFLGRERIFIIARDVTDQVEQQRELQRQTEQFEQFAHIVSHDLRNPLNVAKGRLDLARTEMDPSHLDAVARSHEQMEDLITRLLTLASEGQSSLQRERVDLGTLLDECWQTIQTGRAGLTNRVDCWISADEVRLRQLVENLFRNAVDHTDGRVQIIVGELDDGFFVADDGPGISPEKRTEIFESGYTEAADGTGFGLSIVANVVADHGWDMSVTESVVGGARFEISGVEKRPVG